MTQRHIPGLGATDLVAVGSSPEERASRLDETPWSRDFTWEEILQLADTMRLFRAMPQGLVFKEHADKRFMGVVLSGSVAVLKEDPNRGIQQLVTLGPGQSFGEVSLVDGHRRSAGIVAQSSSDILVLTHPAFEGLCKREPELAVKLLLKLSRLMSGRLRQTSGALIEHLASVVD